MPLNLAHHLKISRCGIFYFRMRVPDALRSVICKREILHSLHTRNPATARKMAYHFASKTYELFEQMTHDPKRFNPADASTFPTADAVKPFEMDLSRGIMKSDNPEDHARMMEALPFALEALKAKQVPQAPSLAVSAPSHYAEPPPAHTITINKALTAYLPTLANPKTRRASERAISQFIDIRGDVEIHTVRGVDVVRWNASMLKTIKPRSADNAIQFLQSLLKWAYKNEYIHHATQLATEGKFNLTKTQRIKATDGAEKFSVEQLIQIFDQKTYSAYCANSKSRYWLPLIGLFTGMRVNEIAQLKVTDIRKIGEVDYVDVNNFGDKKVKTENAVRRIPIHTTLKSLGFLSYVKQRPRNGNLFDETGNAVSHAFIRYLETIGVKKDGDRGMVFHSLRDTFNNTLTIANVSRDLIFYLMGHSLTDTNSISYLAPPQIPRLKVDAIDKLDFVEDSGGVMLRLVL